MGFRDDISFECVAALLDYDRVTGEFVWKARTPASFNAVRRSPEAACNAWNSKYAGKLAGTIDKDGYHIINIYKTRYYAHRLAWLVCHGKWPSNQIDHADRNKLNNRVSNLRVANTAENGWNVVAPPTNTSGYKGVHYHIAARKYHASMRYKGKRVYLGLHNTAYEAHLAYEEAAKKLHGEYYVNQGQIA